MCYVMLAVPQTLCYMTKQYTDRRLFKYEVKANVSERFSRFGNYGHLSLKNPSVSGLYQFSIIPTRGHFRNPICLCPQT